MSDLTPARLADLRAVAKAATPGPWTIRNSYGFFGIVPADGPAVTGMPAKGKDRKHNAAHIAAFDPPTVLALLEEIERLRAEPRVVVADHIDVLNF